MFGDGGGQRRDDAACLFIDAELQRDGRADDGILPVRRRREPARPAHPVIGRALQPFQRDDADPVRQAFIGAEQEADLTVQYEGAAIHDIGDRRVGRDPETGRLVQELDMIDAPARDHVVLAALALGEEVHLDARHAFQRRDPAHHAGRAEHPALVHEARTEVGDLYRGAVLCLQDRLDHGRVALIGLGAGDMALQRDGELAASAEEAVEDRFAIEARQAEPAAGRILVDEARHGAIADNAEFEIGHCVPCFLIQSATACGSASL